jgi:predicted dehydrogenase
MKLSSKMTIMIRLAIFGCGYWGANLIRNIVACEETELAWACDIDSDNLIKSLAPYPAVKRTSDPQDIFTNPDVSGVVIATPVSTHYDLAKKALMSGKHVLVEKPITSTVAQAEELIELAEAHNLQIMCDHTFCYTGAVKKIKEIIDSGELGRPLYYDSIRINLGLIQQDVNVIWDLAIHDLAIVDYLFNAIPENVCAVGVAHTTSNEDVAYLTLTYAGNFIAHFHVNWLSPVKIRKTIIGGNSKMIEWNDLVPAEKIKVYDKGVEIPDTDRDAKKKLRVSYRSGDIFSPYVDTTEALAVIISEFADSIRYNRPPLTDGLAGLRVVRILEASDMSLRLNGKRVPIGV